MPNPQAARPRPQVPAAPAMRLWDIPELQCLTPTTDSLRPLPSPPIDGTCLSYGGGEPFLSWPDRAGPWRALSSLRGAGAQRRGLMHRLWTWLLLDNLTPNAASVTQLVPSGAHGDGAGRLGL